MTEMRKKSVIEEEISRVEGECEKVKKDYRDANDEYKSAIGGFGAAITASQRASSTSTRDYWRDKMSECQRRASEKTELKESLNRKMTKLVDDLDRLTEELNNWHNKYNTDPGFRDYVDRLEEEERRNKYNSLIDKMKSASTPDDFKSLAIQFRSMAPYENSGELANECEQAAKKIRYAQLVQEKNTASKEDEYLNLAKEFRKMGPYENSRELARECEQAAKKILYAQLVQEKNIASKEDEYQNLAREFSKMIPYEDSSKLANECDEQYRKLENARKEAERWKRRKIILWQVAAWILAIVAVIMAICNMFLRYPNYEILAIILIIISFLFIFHTHIREGKILRGRVSIKNIVFMTLSVYASIILIFGGDGVVGHPFYRYGTIYTIVAGLCNLSSCIIAFIFPKHLH